ncbi:MAG: V-type ATP synthase subunit B [Spirochaetes bacterium]|uniref:V-type ATP synthase beta chain n=1 Tax=Candidatus Aphodenecus pullistercoris TaxID=2840669 RepID=A0A9D9HA26_9SPIR|nr:V-type ATP synthase subunit B [Candidatus Aphodenecus pullistercoris]
MRTEIDRTLLRGREYRGASRIDGPLVYMRGTHPVGYNELVEITCSDGKRRSGQVLDTSDDVVCVQVFEGTDGLNMPDTRMHFLGEPLSLSVTEDMLGRVMNGLGKARDGGADPHGSEERDVNGSPINPTSREYPRDYIQTGISVIDGMTTLIQGQKLPIFSGNGLSHNQLAAQIARQAKVRGGKGDFCIVFCAMGVKYDIAKFFIDSFEETGVLDNVALFLSLADDPSIERTITPRTALTLAEHLAFDKGKQVLVIMTDMTNYCESLREISTLRGEIPSRKGYPGYLYSNLAELYERSGKIAGRSGSITQLPILTMPNDDISHPIPDLTGYITEGQIVFDRQLGGRGIYPPINPLPSLSRLMKDGIGEGMTRADHPHVSNQLFASYSHVQEVRNLASVIGEEELSETDNLYMKFGEFFESRFLSQGQDEDRSIEETLDLAWKALSILPPEELQRLTEEEISAHYSREE